MSQGNLFTPAYESRACARCGGTGTHHPHDVVRAVRCSSCKTTGRILTKRGKAARDYHRNRLIKPASSVSPGEVLWFNLGHTKVATTVLSVEPVGMLRLKIEGERRREDEAIAVCLVASNPVEVAYSSEELFAIRDEVLAYQETLTKAGVVSRRLKVA